MKVKAQIAVATVSGRAYFKIVNKLKDMNLPFLSLVPGEPIPPWIKVVITTESEKQLISHPKVLAYNSELDPSSIVGEALRIIMSKEIYEDLVIGVDPGKTFGVAVIADGKTIRREEGLSMEKTIDLILDELKRNPSKNQTIRIGRGLPETAEEIARRLEAALPENILIEMVDENGTSTLKSRGFKRKLSDADSAIKIASKKGEPRLRSV